MRHLRVFPTVIAVCFCGLASAQNLSSPTATLSSFVRLVEAGRFSEAANCVSGANPKADYARFKLMVARAPIKITVDPFTAKVSGARATAMVRYKVRPVKGKEVRSNSETIVFARASGKWRLVAAPMQTQSLAKELGQLILNVRYPDRISAIQTMARQGAESLAKIKQLAMATIMYASDNDDKMPPYATWGKLIHPYHKNPNIVFAPGAPKTSPSYSYNPAVAGISYVRMRDPSRLVMLYEGQKGRLNYAHDGRAAVAFMDGSCKLVGPADAKGLKWKP